MQSSAPTIGVVIPTFNCAAYLRGAIASCVLQAPHLEEIIVVDDGSTDDTSQVLESLRNIGNLKILRQQNSGISAARNAGVAASRADFVCFLDADDEFLSGAIESRRRAILTRPDVDFFFSDYRIQDAPHVTRLAFSSLDAFRALKPWLAERNEAVATLTPTFGAAYGSGSINKALVHTSAVTMRRSLFERLNGFDVTYDVAEDQELWERSFNAGASAVLLSGPGSTYFKWRGSRSKYEAAFEVMMASLGRKLAARKAFSRGWWEIRRRMAEEHLTLVYALGILSAPRWRVLQLLAKSVGYYPLPAKQLLYFASVCVPRKAIGLAYAAREWIVSRRDA